MGIGLFYQIEGGVEQSMTLEMELDGARFTRQEIIEKITNCNQEMEAKAYLAKTLKVVILTTCAPVDAQDATFF